MRRAIMMVALSAMAAAAAIAPAQALASSGGPQWTVTAVSGPTNFKPGDSSGRDVYRVSVTNTGATASDGTAVQITDELPVGLSLDGAGASGESPIAKIGAGGSVTAGFSCLFDSCTYSGVVIPDQTLVISFPVDVAASPPSSCPVPAVAVACVTNVVHVSGGGALDASAATPTVISEAPAAFGLSPGGESTALSSTQAGAHPDITTSIAFNTVNAAGALAGDPKDTTDELPPGFAGDLIDTPTCAAAAFTRNECGIATQIGVTTITTTQEGYLGVTQNTFIEPVYNIAPNPGEVAKFGFSVAAAFFIQGNVSVRPGDYGLRVSFHDVNEVIVEVDQVSLTVWGVPAARVHDPLRAEFKQGGYKFGISSKAALAPYFTNPTSCEEPLEAVFSVTSWQGGMASAGMPFGPIVGCDRLSLPASFTAEATTERADSPTGLDVNLAVKQTYGNAEGLAASTLDKAVVTLPEGMTVNPSAGSGLGACTLAQYQEEALELSATGGCPNDSKLGSVEITTPALPEKAIGSVFLAQPASNGEAGKNPFDSLLAIYVVARFKERGVLVKVAGRVTPDPVTGRLVTTFEDQPELGPLPNGERQPGLAGLPPVPFTTFVFKFHQGATSPLVTPPTCGSYDATAELNPWSEPLSVLTPEPRPFEITQAFDGGPCPSGAAPFSPQVIAGTEDNAAGSYSPLNLRIVREDGEQEITGFSTQLPPGVTASLVGVPFCTEAEIAAARGRTGAQEEAEPSCPAASEIGRTLVGAGVGSVLAWAPGKVYMGGPFEGAPFSVVSITSAKVGPFDLGTVVVHLPLYINPITAQVSIPQGAADQIPHIIKGIVVHVRDIRVYIDRPKFTVNPTSCAPMNLSATVMGSGVNFASAADDVPATVSDRFQAADCGSLAFNPSFVVSTSATTSKRLGASLHVALTYPKESLGKDANIREVKVELPVQLPARQETLNQACVVAVFEADPANCPTGSRVGYAKATTPILPAPLQGPAYFVSYGGAQFPELVVVLQGDGVTIDLHGETFISEKTSVISSTFKSVPDQPVESFELDLPQGRYSALAANGNFCATPLKMPTTFIAQNGARIEQSTNIEVSGCKPTLLILRHKAKGHTLAVTVNVPAAGTLTASGQGLSRISRKVDGAGPVTLNLRLSAHDRRLLARNPGRRLKVTVALRFAPQRDRGQAVASRLSVLMR